jgi:DNA helicase HerA-like ATPase
LRRCSAASPSIWPSGAKSKIQTLVVCEEAHRYIPADQSAGFAPTRSAIARIAKEGRKYGVYLSIVTQRPGELDETILSQCNTFFSMRLGNERDQEIMRKRDQRLVAVGDQLPAVARQPRGDCLRAGCVHADAHDVRDGAKPNAVARQSSL